MKSKLPSWLKEGYVPAKATKKELLAALAFADVLIPSINLKKDELIKHFNDNIPCQRLNLVKKFINEGDTPPLSPLSLECHLQTNNFKPILHRASRRSMPILHPEHEIIPTCSSAPISPISRPTLSCPLPSSRHLLPRTDSHLQDSTPKSRYSLRNHRVENQSTPRKECLVPKTDPFSFKTLTNWFAFHFLPPNLKPLTRNLKERQAPTLLWIIVLSTILFVLSIKAFIDAGYCPSIYPQILAESTGAAFFNQFWPSCTRCPSHATCVDGNLEECTNDYVIKGNLGISGLLRLAYCDPASEQRRNVELLINLAVEELAALVGARKCAGVSEWIGKATVRRIIDGKAKDQPWEFKKAAGYADLAFNEIFLIKRDNVKRLGVTPLEYKLGILRPTFPLPCKLRLLLLDIFSIYLHRSIFILLAALALLRLWRWHVYNCWCKKQVALLCCETLQELKTKKITLSLKMDKVQKYISQQNLPLWVSERIWSDFALKMSEKINKTL